MVMIERLKSNFIQKSLKAFPAVGIIGPRQCGKTTLAKSIAKSLKKEVFYLDMESPKDFDLLDNDPEFFFDKHLNDCVILDEIQVKPDLFPVMRSSIDKNRKPGRFIILGSSSPKLIQKSNESLAGRISYHELSPFNLIEIKTKEEKHWLRGGYPEAVLNKSQETTTEWLTNYINTYVSRDLPAIGLTTTPSTIYKLWKMISGINANILNVEDISRSLGVSASSIRNYLDFMEEAFLIRRLHPYYVNIGKRLVKNPKIYVRDSGILHTLLSITNPTELEFSAMVGASWEGYVIEQICQLLPSTIEPYFYRTHNGSEVDLVLVKGVMPICCIEVKYSLSPSVSKGFWISVSEDLKTEKNYIIIPRGNNVQIKENVWVMPLLEFLQEIIPSL
jgi:predicted AAA+ superfamily ATPase